MKAYLVALTSLFLVAGPLPALADSNVVSLTNIANADNYHYNYSGANDFVELSKGKLSIVIRPGEALYDVNDRSVSVDGLVPELKNGDIYVSKAFAKRLKKYAQTQMSYEPKMMTSSKVTMSKMISNKIKTSKTQETALSTEEKEIMPVTNLILAQADAENSVNLNGHTGANESVSLTLTGLVGEDVPRVTISRKTITSDSDGYFSTTIPLQSLDYFGSIVEVFAVPTDSKDLKPDRATIVMKRILDNSHIPSEDVPRWVSNQH